jgi:hypothetical protein
VGQREVAEVVSTAAQLGLPILAFVGNLELAEDELDDAIEQCGLVGGVPVQSHRIPAELTAESTPGQRVKALGIDQA